MPIHPMQEMIWRDDFIEPEIGTVTPQPIAEAAATGDGKSLPIACEAGRQNGPYDLDLLAIDRAGVLISPVRLIVEGGTLTPIFADPLEPGDVFVGF